MKAIAIILFSTLLLTAKGQEKAERFKHIDSLYTEGFIGYQKDFLTQIYYPQEIREEKIIGNVYFSAEIDTTGYISDFKIIKGLDYRLDKIVKEKFQNTDGKWRQFQDKNGDKISYKISDYVYFELK